jgi:hypothetical protein
MAARGSGDGWSFGWFARAPIADWVVFIESDVLHAGLFAEDCLGLNAIFPFLISRDRKRCC